jgi:predicted transcriptional regulator
VSEELEQNALATITAEVVSAYFSHNQIALPDLAKLIGAVAGELRKVGTEVEQSEETKPEPAVPIRRSIHPDHLVCLVCGKPQKMLKRHLAVQHDLTPAQYRERFGLKPDYPMAAPNSAQQRRELAVKIGLGQPKRSARRRRKSTARSRTKNSGQPATARAGS